MSNVTRRRIGTLAVFALVVGAVGSVGGSAVASPAGEPPGWGRPQVVDRLVGNIREVDCASSDFCRAYDNHGNVFTMRDGTWSQPTWTGAQAGALFSMSCPEVRFCAAVDAAGNWLANDGHGWSDPAPIFAGAELYEIDCTSETFCMAVGHGSPRFLSSTWDGASWSDPATIPGPSEDVACASPQLCVAEVSEGKVMSFDGLTWSEPVELVGVGAPRDVSCSPDGLCAVIGASSSATFEDGDWSDPAVVTTHRDLTALSCASGPVCYAVREAGVAFRYGDGAWRSAGRVGRPLFQDIDCTDAGHCLATKWRSQSFVLDGGSWLRDAHITTLRHGIVDVACASPGACTAVDDSGGAVRYDGTRWQRPVQISGHHRLVEVTCPTADTCFAISWSGLVWRFDGTTWSDQPPARLPARVAALSCPTTTFCMALDQGGRATSFDGTSWTDRGTLQGTGVVVLSCASPTFCGAAVDADFSFWEGDHWRHDSQRDLPAWSISCPVDGFCLGVYWQSVVQYEQGEWTTGYNPLHGFTEVSCASTEFCVATSSFDASVFDGDEWSYPEDVGPDPGQGINYDSHVSCPEPRFCMMVTYDGWAVRYGG